MTLCFCALTWSDFHPMHPTCSDMFRLSTSHAFNVLLSLPPSNFTHLTTHRQCRQTDKSPRIITLCRQETHGTFKGLAGGPGVGIWRSRLGSEGGGGGRPRDCDSHSVKQNRSRPDGSTLPTRFPHVSTCKPIRRKCGAAAPAWRAGARRCSMVVEGKSTMRSHRGAMSTGARGKGYSLSCAPPRTSCACYHSHQGIALSDTGVND